MSSDSSTGQADKAITTTPGRLLRGAGWCLAPGKGLGGVVLLGFVSVAVVSRGGRATLWYLIAVVAFWWLAVMLVAALIPPLEPLRNRSALASRLGSLVNALWKTFMFGAAAAYSAIVSIAIGAMPRAAAFTAFWPMIWPPLELVGVAAALYTAMVCAADVARTGADTRSQALHNMRARLHSYLSFPEQSDPWLAGWVEEIIRWCVSGARPFIAAYLAPMVIVLTWAVLHR